MKKFWLALIIVVILLSTLGSLYYFSPKKDLKENKITGGIIPHHLLADFAIEQFFAKVKDNSLELVVLLGPNHFEKGDMVLSTNVEWTTERGIVGPETGIINKLSEENWVVLNQKILTDEHSINSIVPFVKTYFPRAKIIPIIFRRNVDLTTLQNLSGEILKNVRKKTIFIASVDFSHYLNSEESAKKDMETLSIIKNFDYSKLLTLDNDHLDSPSSVAMLLLTMQKVGLNKFEVLFHSNSGEILKNSSAPATSYFTILFN